LRSDDAPLLTRRAGRISGHFSGQSVQAQVNTNQHYLDEGGPRVRTSEHESTLAGPSSTNIADLQNQRDPERGLAGSIPVRLRNLAFEQAEQGSVVQQCPCQDALLEAYFWPSSGQSVQGHRAAVSLCPDRAAPKWALHPWVTPCRSSVGIGSHDCSASSSR
jgi:hypothetical protein